MAITWGAYSNRWRLGLDLVGNTMILYGESNAYGFNINNGTIVFGGDSSGSKTFSFYSGFGQTVRKELHRWSIGSGSHTATASVNHYVSGVGTINATVTRTRTVTPTPSAPRIDRVVRISDTSHRVEWTRNATATSVRLERRTNDGSWQHVSSVSSNAASITDTTTKAGNKYQYRVRVANAGGTSAWSNLSNNIYTTPTAPTGVTATRVGNDIRVSMTMPARSTHLDIQDDGTTVVSALAKGSLPWTHSSPSPVVTHRYRARSRISTGAEGNATLYSSWSTYSSTVQLTAAPNAPTGLNPNGSTVEASAPITLRWQHNPVDSSQQSAVEIQSRLAGGSWGTVYTGATETTWSTTGGLLALGVGQVEWRVRTKGAHPDWSPWSAVALLDVISKPTVTIQTPSAGDFHEAELTVTWSFFQAQGRPQSGWDVYLLLDGQIVDADHGTGSRSSYTFRERLVDGGTYEVRVQAGTGGIFSDVESVTVDASFILPAPGVLAAAWNENTGAVDLDVSIIEQDYLAPVTNYAPRIEGSGAWVALRRNLFLDPHTRNPNVYESNNFVSNPELGPGIDGSNSTVQVSRVAAGTARFSVFSAPLTGVSVLKFSTYATQQLAGVQIQIRPRVTENARVVTIFSGTLPQGQRNFEFTVTTPPDEETGYQYGLVFLWGSGDIGSVLRVGGAMQLESGERLGPFFSGSYQRDTDPDVRTRWVGVTDASVSVMEGERVVGVPALDSQRVSYITRDSPPEGFSVANRYLLMSAAAVGLQLGSGVVTPGEIATIEFLVRPKGKDLRAIPRIQGTEGAIRTFPADVWTRVAITAEAGTSSLLTGLILNSALPHEAGDIVDIAMPGLYSGTYTDDYFDGDTVWVNIQGRWMHTRWNPDGTSVASMPDEAISVTVERSVDGGITWAPVADNLKAGTHQLTDPMALSNGVTLYRVTTYAATGAAKAREFPATSDSGAIWLGGGVGFSDTVALPHSPQVTVTASRERVLKRYSGRALPVVHSGEGVTRVVDTGGLVRVPWGDRTETDALERIALAGEPLALYRDPDGRWVVGMLGEVSMSRENHYWWAYGFTLTESEA